MASHYVVRDGRGVSVQHHLYQGHDIYLCVNCPSGGRAAIYAPTLHLLADCPSPSKGPGPAVLADILADSPALQEKLSEGVAKWPLLRHQRKRTPQFFPLSIGLTRDCSLNCVYCHADAGMQRHIDTTLITDSLYYAIRAIRERNLKGLHVSFAVGGEPTLPWKDFQLFVDAVNRAAREHDIEVYKSITTNGFYGKEKREYITANFDTILLSFDGPEPIQNRLRPCKSGRPSFATVLETAQYFTQYQDKFAVRATLPKSSLAHVKEIIYLFKNDVGLRRNHDAVLEPMIGIGRGAKTSETPPTGEEFAHAFWEARQYGRSLDVNVKSSAFNANRLVATFCHAMSIPSFSVTTDGRITACERDCEGTDYCYGQYDFESREFVLDKTAMEHNIACAEPPTYCGECLCKWHCAGDCPDTRRFGFDRCDGNRYLLVSYMEELLGSDFRE
ncbi:MAG: radical SAM protein [Roseiarcus sp.]